MAIRGGGGEEGDWEEVEECGMGARVGGEAREKWSREKAAEGGD